MTFPHPGQEAFENKPLPFCRHQIQVMESGDWFHCIERLYDGHVCKCKYETIAEAKKCEYFMEIERRRHDS